MSLNKEIHIKESNKIALLLAILSNSSINFCTLFNSILTPNAFECPSTDLNKLVCLHQELKSLI